MAKGIYLDNSMTTRPSDKAVSSMLPFLTEQWGASTAPHLMGQELFPAMKEAMISIFKLIDAKENDNLVFTSSGAEAVNHAILSTYFDVTRATGRNQFITSLIDEAPALMSINRLEQLGCVSRTVAPNKDGIITAEAIADMITPRTAMVSISWANALTGVINPVEQIGKLCYERGIRFHVDATHVLGKLFFDLESLNAQFLTFNGDNIHAPKGTGGLYIKSGTLCTSLIAGGVEQEARRAGVINTPALVALGTAANEAIESRDYLCTEIARLRNHFEQGILEKFPEAKIFFQNTERLPNISCIAFPGITNEALMYALNKKNVFACIGGGSFQQIYLLLAAIGIPEVTAHSAISFSLSRYTTEDEIDRAIELIGEAANRLRKASLHLIPEVKL